MSRRQRRIQTAALRESSNARWGSPSRLALGAFALDAASLLALPAAVSGEKSGGEGKAKADVVKLTEATTVQGQAAKIVVADGKVKIDAAAVTATDIGASNGVIHVIDSVILPN